MRPSLDTDFFSTKAPRAFGHRGSAGTHPENTLISFRAGYAAGARHMEFDVHMTRDGEIVVAHDESLERACGRAGLIKEMAWDEIIRADAGYTFGEDRGFPFRGKGVRIPRLADVLKEFPDVRFIIEVKQTAPTLVAAMLSIIDRYAMRRMVLVASEHQQPLDEIRKLAPGIPTNFAYHEVAGFMQAMAARDANYRPPGDALQIPPTYGDWRLVTPKLVAWAHECGLVVDVWTVNDESEMTSLLDIGVDGILSDYPERLIRLIERRARQR
ncbi:MAG TPA: glycerophosphodiester phosphodiesterase [Candidatus Binataceae bacterium]|nr:glycerophosphodiester phosphodiesterase [Candidatus Binataceae bacterium]